MTPFLCKPLISSAPSSVVIGHVAAIHDLECLWSERKKEASADDIG
jgi:hypothetical protein